MREDQQTCGCPCGLVHPQRKNICDVHRPVTTRQMLHVQLEQVVPMMMCQQCADELDRLRAEFGKEAKP